MQSRADTPPRQVGPPFGQAGIPRLAVTALLVGAVVGLLGSGIAADAGARAWLLIGSACGVGGAALVIVGWLAFWRGEGGRPRSIELDVWTRDRRLPEGPLPPDTAQHLSKRGQRLSRFGVNVTLGAFYILFAIGQYLSHRSGGQAMISCAMVAVWLGAIAVSAYSRFRTYPVVQGLTAEADRRAMAEWRAGS